MTADTTPTDGLTPTQRINKAKRELLQAEADLTQNSGSLVNHVKDELTTIGHITRTVLKNT